MKKMVLGWLPADTYMEIGERPHGVEGPEVERLEFIVGQVESLEAVEVLEGLVSELGQLIPLHGQGEQLGHLHEGLGCQFGDSVVRERQVLQLLER